MITERDIAKRFSATWLESFPVLSANFMRVFNESHISQYHGNQFVPILGHSDVVSEYGFFLAKLAFEEKIDLHDARISVPLHDTAFSNALSTFHNTSRVSDLPDNLSEEERKEGLQLASNILSFINSFNPTQVTFMPKVSGYGIIGACNADVSIDHTLFEIKTVKRTFRSKDLKQLILYLALGTISGEQEWSHAGLYNPRSGRFCRFNIAGLIGYLSGGRTPIDAFRRLLDSLS